MGITSVPLQQKVKLDLYDKKIIFYLSQNSRISLTDLAKKLRISVQRCKYKISRLEENILEPAPFLTFQLLDMSSYIIFTSQLDTKIINEILSDDSVFFMMQTIGKYQYVINIVTNDVIDFLNKYLSSNHVEINPIVNLYADDYNPFNLKIEPKPLKRNNKISLDKKDYRLLSHLCKRPRDSFTEIQTAIKIDRQTIKNKIRRFEDNNIIQKFRYGINIFKLGYIGYVLKINFVSKNKKIILEAIRRNIYSGFVFESYSSFTMQFIPPSHNEVFEFMKTLENLDTTIKIEIVQNTEFYKIDLVPKAVIKLLEERSR